MGSQLTSADLWDYAAEYTGFDIFARQLARVPLTGDVAQPCEYAAFVPLALGQYAMNSGLTPQLDAVMKAQAEFGAPGATGSTSHHKGHPSKLETTEAR